jgi:hypothetical protein
MRLIRLLLIPLTLLLIPGIALAAEATQKGTKPAPTKKPSVQAKSGGTGAAASKTAKKAPAKKTASKSKSKSKARSKSAARQQQPSETRIREIQEALTAKGYPVEASGKWGSDSVEALQKFQEDQKITNMSGRGKLDSLTLIALGLGPQSGTSQWPAGKETTAETEGKNQ